MTARFGLLFMPTPPKAFAEWTRLADEAGFERIGIGDSQSLYRDVYVSATIAALNTDRAQIGPRVTNPITRHPTVTASAIASIDELTGGRAFLGIGTGHSALLNVGRRPATIDQLREYVVCVRTLFEQGEAEYQGRTVRLSWPTAPSHPRGGRRTARPRARRRGRGRRHRRQRDDARSDR